jgi:hypothetical protein
MPVKRFPEILAILLLLVLGLAPRLAFVSAFPTIPLSDADGLVMFGLHLRDHGLFSPIHFWEQFNPALPLVLCGLFHVFPHADPGAVARLATACVCGLLPLLPFLIWRGVLPFWVRLSAGAALGLWPGQVVFSGVVLQDNWVILPSVALGALAVRSLLSDDRTVGKPAGATRLIAAGLLYAAGAAFRQEMLVVLLPLFLAAASRRALKPAATKPPALRDLLAWRPMRNARAAAAAILAAGLPLLALAAYRDAATGHFALTTPHGGVTVLGSYIPGAGANGWTHPGAYIASVRPEMLRDRELYFSESGRLALREALRRPVFHAARIVSTTGNAALSGEAFSMAASLAPEALPAEARKRAAVLAMRLDQPLRFELAAIHVLFLAAIVVAIVRRNMPILVLASALLLKYALHAVTVVFGRFFLVSTAWGILAIVLAAYEISIALPGTRRLVVRGLAIGVAAIAGLFLFAPRLAAVVASHDLDDPQRTYRFQLEPPDATASLACVVDRGLLYALDWNRFAMLRTRLVDPAPGDRAVAVCELTGRGEPKPLVLQVLDPYAPGGFPDRMLQRVEVDGAEVLSNDIARVPWSGWIDIPLGKVGTGTKRKVVIEVRAVQPDVGPGWGSAAVTRFQLAAGSPDLNLAMSKPAAQSSTLASSATTGAGKAVDGKTDGFFYNGSVTSTNQDPNAWWEVDLLASAPIGSIAIWNRADCCSERLDDYWVFVSDTPFRPTDTPATLKSRAGTWSSHQTAAPHPSVSLTPSGARGRYVRVQLNGTGYLSLAEVQVFAQ